MLNSNFSFGWFLNKNIKEVDFSYNDLSGKFAMFESLTHVEKIKLRKVSLQSMEQISFAKYLNLVYLDLSFNNLTRLIFESFKNLNKLVILDLSNNWISFIDKRIFSVLIDPFYQIKPLKYLNLEHNQIVSFEDAFINYGNIETVIMSFNLMNHPPIFKFFTIDNYYVNTKYLFLNNNNMTKLSYMNENMVTLLILNLDSNNIQFIEPNALSLLYKLENISMSYNFLTEIIANNFLNQVQLKYLNLSHNLIDSIEVASFRNLINLQVLDLNFNRLKFIKSNVWYGLSNLNDLYLVSNFEFELKNDSLNHLQQIKNLYLNNSIIIKYKCIFMHSVRREIQRNVSNGKIVFLKSLNLISAENA